MPHSVPTKGSACNQHPPKKHFGVRFGSALSQETCISSGHKRVYPLNFFIIILFFGKKLFGTEGKQANAKIENQERRRAVYPLNQHTGL